MGDLWESIEDLLGLNDQDLGAVAMALRTVLVYAVTLAIVHAGNKRFLGKATAFDVILGIMLGSVMSRAITGSSPLFPTLFAGAVFVGLHWLVSALAFRADWFGSMVKGNPVALIRDGTVQQGSMRRTAVTSNDLDEAQRLSGREPDTSGIQAAYLERSGDISVIPRSAEPRVVEVAVEAGVQTVRIELT